jgi:uncharacterized protein DUF481
MPARHTCLRTGALVAVAILAVAPPAFAQPKTDVVTLANGDRITGEIVILDRGRLEFKTDDAGTLYLEWDKLSSLVSRRFVEVVLTDGLRYFGSLGAADSGTIAVVGTDATHRLAMTEVTILRPIGTSFWKKVDGSIDAGFNYTRSSGVAQLNVNWETLFRQPASQSRVMLSLTLTRTDEDSGRDDRGYAEFSYLKYPWRRWFIMTAGRFETNESLGLTLRSQIAAAIGPRVINSNRAQMAFGGGLVLNNEQGVDVESTRNVEALLIFRTSYFTYDRPKTNIDVSLQYYPSLSNAGRQRLQLDAGVKREFWKDLFLSLTGYNTYDSRPPNPAADTNDVGFVMSIGWTY